MKVLLLTSETYSPIFSEFYVGLHKSLGSMDVRRLGDDQKNLRSYFSHHIDLTKYDRIIIHLKFSVLRPQLRFLRQLDNVVFYDTSVHNGASPDAGGVDAHVAFYQKMPWARVIVSNYTAMTAFQREGLDAWCVPKGYNSQHYKDKQMTRAIPLMFIKNNDEPASGKAESFEARLLRRFPNLRVENNFVEPGTSQLGRTAIAVCADFDRNEYSSKIFQAMACGCLVAALNQGNEENFYLSLSDMDNIVLFDDAEMLFEKINTLTKHPALMNSIIKKGQELAKENHQQFTLGTQAADYIVAGMRDKKDYRIGISAFGWRF